MPWSTPRVWATAELVTAANMNTYISEDLSVLRAGGVAIASQAAGDFLFASSSTQLGRLAVGGAYQGIRRNSANSAYEFFRPWGPRITAETSNANPVMNNDIEDVHIISALATAAAWTATGSTHVNSERVILRIRDNGTARALSWNAVFQAQGVALPTTTVINKWLSLVFIHDPYNAKWGLIGAAQEA